MLRFGWSWQERLLLPLSVPQLSLAFLGCESLGDLCGLERELAMT